MRGVWHSPAAASSRRYRKELRAVTPDMSSMSVIMAEWSHSPRPAYCTAWNNSLTTAVTGNDTLEFAGHVHGVTQVLNLRVYFPSRFKIPRQHLGCFDVQRSTTRQASTHRLNEQGRINTSFGAVDQGFT